MIVVPGPASQRLGKSIAAELGVEPYPLEWRVFPDGESYIRYPRPVGDERIVIVQSCPPPTDRNLMQLFLMAEGARKKGANDVTAVIPYLAYMRQDKAFRVGDVVSIDAVARLVQAVGIGKVVTVDVHSEESLAPFKIPIKNVSAMPALAEYLKTLPIRRPLILAPDKGGKQRAKLVAEKLGAKDCVVLDKRRDRVTGQVDIDEKAMDLAGRDVVIVDDIISTGGTIVKAAEMASKQMAKSIYAVCTHALLMGDAKERMKQSGVTRIIGTDTVENETSIVSVASTIASILG
jgi:ribose-phosphate pyrophosphokinase